MYTDVTMETEPHASTNRHCTFVDDEYQLHHIEQCYVPPAEVDNHLQGEGGQPGRHHSGKRAKPTRVDSCPFRIARTANQTQ